MFSFNRTYRLYALLAILMIPCLLFAQNGREKATYPGIEDTEEQRVSIVSLSELNFGAFYPGKFGGSIEIDPDGMRSTSGSVIPLHSELNPSAAVFEIKCPSNTLIHVVIDQQIELRDESGHTLICEPILTEPDHFMSPENAEEGFIYRLGATLKLPDATFESAINLSGKINIFLLLE